MIKFETGLAFQLAIQIQYRNTWLVMRSWSVTKERKLAEPFLFFSDINYTFQILPPIFSFNTF